jgi:iron complex outermembrane receptor protein
VFGQTSTHFSNNEGSITPRTKLPGYATVDVRLSWNEVMGSKFSVAAYAKNLLDEFYYNSGYVEGGSGGFNTAIWGEPQTFGAEVTYRF